MRHLLILLLILFLSSFLTSCEKKNGPGTETYEDGSSYVGVFKDGERNGQGTYTFHDGVKWVGVWRKSEPWNITKYDKDGKIYGRKVNGVRQ